MSRSTTKGAILTWGPHLIDVMSLSTPLILYGNVYALFTTVQPKIYIVCKSICHRLYGLHDSTVGRNSTQCWSR